MRRDKEKKDESESCSHMNMKVGMEQNETVRKEIAMHNVRIESSEYHPDLKVRDMSICKRGQKKS